MDKLNDSVFYIYRAVPATMVSLYSWLRTYGPTLQEVLIVIMTWMVLHQEVSHRQEKNPEWFRCSRHVLHVLVWLEHLEIGMLHCFPLFISKISALSLVNIHLSYIDSIMVSCFTINDGTVSIKRVIIS